jgi:hypothetical protein
MKKTLISLAALAALSTAALAAGNHSWDNRDVQGQDASGAEPGSSYNYYQSAPTLKRHGTVLEAEPLAIPSGAGEPSVSALSPYGDQGLSNFEKMQFRSEQRDQGDR